MAALALKTDFNLNSINKLPGWAQILIVILAPVLVVTAFYFVQYQPKNQQINSLLSHIQKQENEISIKETKARRLVVLKAENEWLKARLKELQEQLPEEKEVSGLLRQISDLGLSSGLEIISWIPGQKRTNPSGLYDEIPVKIVVTGGFHNLGKFFSNISAMTRIVNIAEIQVSSSKKQGKNVGTGNLLDVKFTATAFAATSKTGQSGGGKR